VRFQPGQSGNPAGRPLGSRNKATIAAQELFAATAVETAKFIIARAQCGNSTAMRLCVERTPPDVKLPTVKCADDAQKALDTVIEAFGRGAARRLRRPTSRTRQPATSCIFLLIRTRSRSPAPPARRRPLRRAGKYQANFRLMPPSTTSSRPVT
jgi:hypothetical protein